MTGILSKVAAIAAAIGLAILIIKKWTTIKNFLSKVRDWTKFTSTSLSNRWRRLAVATSFWQFAVAIAAFLIVVSLARYRVWPFGTRPRNLGNNPSIFELVLDDRLMIGFLRAGVVAIAFYVIVSVPALIVARRWMKGLSTAGLAADEAQGAVGSIEELQNAVKEKDRALESQVLQNDILQQLLLETESELDEAHELVRQLQSKQASEHDSSEEGGAQNGEDG